MHAALIAASPVSNPPSPSGRDLLTTDSFERVNAPMATLLEEVGQSRVELDRSRRRRRVGVSSMMDVDARSQARKARMFRLRVDYSYLISSLGSANADTWSHLCSRHPLDCQGNDLLRFALGVSLGGLAYLTDPVRRIGVSLLFHAVNELRLGIAC